MADQRFANIATRLRSDSDGWIRGHWVPAAIYEVGLKANMADNRFSEGALYALEHALAKLDVEIERYKRRLVAFQQQVVAYAQEVNDARAALAADDPDHKPLVERQDAIDDATIERIAGYYNPRSQRGYWRD